MRKLVKAILVVFTLILSLGSANAQQPPATLFQEGELISPNDALTYYGVLESHTNFHNTSYYSETEITVLADRIGRKLLNNNEITQEEYISRAFKYVQNNIEVTFTFGLTKGGRGALIDQAGTPFDQTQLFIELLRVANVSASYSLGILTISPEEFGLWTGLVVPTIVSAQNEVTSFNVNAKAACRFLANGGIPAVINGLQGDGTCDYSGNLTGVQILHVWATVGGVDYDPTIKKYSLYSSTALVSATSCGTKSNCASQAVVAGMLNALSGEDGTMPTGSVQNAKYIKNYNESNLETALNSYAEDIQNYISTSMYSASLEEFIGGKILKPQKETDIFTSIMRQSSKTWTTEIPDQYRSKVTVQFDQINKSLWADEISGRRLRIFGLNGQAISTLEGGHSRKITLYLEYEILDTSVNVNATLENDTLTLVVDPPYAASNGLFLNRTHVLKTDSSQLNFFAVENGVYVNDLCCTLAYFSPLTIVASFGDIGAGALRHYTALQEKNRRYFSAPDTSFPAHDYIFNYPETFCKTSILWDMIPVNGTGRQLRFECLRLQDPTLAANYLVQDSRLQRLAGAINASQITTHQLIGFVSRGAVSIEADRSVVARDNNNIDEKSSILAGTLVSNWLEGGVSEQSTGQWENGSALWYFSRANEDGQKFYFMTSNNKPTVFANTINYSLTHQSLFQEYLSSSHQVILPENSFGGSFPFITVNSWGPGTASKIFIRNSAFPFSSDLRSLGAIMNSGFKGGDPIIKDPQDDILKSAKAISESSLPSQQFSIKEATGSLTLSPVADLSVGAGGFPKLMSFSRNYNSLISAVANTPGVISGGQSSIPIRDFPILVSSSPGAVIGAGWEHNFQISINMESAPLQAMGEDSALDASSFIAGLYVLSGLAQNMGQNDHSLSSLFVTNWIGKNTVLNALNVKARALSGNYIKLPDGTYNPPNGIVASITQEGTILGPFMMTNTSIINIYSKIKFTLEDSSGAKLFFRTAQKEYGIGEYLGNTSSGGGQSYRRLDLRRFQPYRWDFPTGEYIDFEYMNSNLQQHCLAKIINNYGRELNFTYHPIGDTGLPSPDSPCAIATVNDGNGRTVSYDGIIHREATKQWQPFTMTVTYPNGSKDFYDYNSSMVEQISPHQLLSQLTGWRKSGKPNVKLLLGEYDQRGFLSSVSDALNNNTRYSFQFFGNDLSARTVRLDALGNSTISLFDHNKNLLEAHDALGRVISFVYDGIGRNISKVSPEGNTIKFTYDNKNNLVQEKNISKPNSTAVDLVIGFAYGDTKWPTKVTEITDANGNKTYASYDSLTGLLLRKIQETQANTCSVNTVTSSDNCIVTSYSYKSVVPNLLETATDAEGMVTRFSFDGVGNLISTIRDEGGKNLKTVYFYDQIGNLCETVDPRGTAGLIGGYKLSCDQ